MDNRSGDSVNVIIQVQRNHLLNFPKVMADSAGWHYRRKKFSLTPPRRYRRGRASFAFRDFEP